jgi:hypothetical protein
VSGRKSLPSFPSIDREALRDHGDPKRIDRVWERIERNLVLEPKAASAETSNRWPFVSAALAAGFALGVGVSGWLWVDEGPKAPVVMHPAETESSVEVFAAGTAPRSYPLAGGGLITVEPGSIVDTVSRDGDHLTLRLVRGEATLSTAAGSTAARGAQVALLVGGAQVTPSGQMRIRHDGDTAYVQVLDGSAAVNAPDTGSGTREMVLGPDQEATVPVRVVTASVDPVRMAPRSPSEEPEEATSTATDETTDEAAVVAVAAMPEWEKACSDGDDKTAAKLFAESGGDPSAIDNAALMSCLALGRRALKDVSGAIAVNERLITEFEQSQPLRAMTAAYDLADLYKKLGQPDKAMLYRQKAHELSKGMLLTEQALCEKIQAEGLAGNGEQVRALGQQYVQQYPDGPCTEIVEKLLAAHALPEPAPVVEEDEDGEADDEAPTEPDPYEDAGDTE